MDDCIFCKIVAGKLPDYRVYEDDLFIGFLDIFPRVKGHVLVIPKKHYRWVYDVPEFGKYWEAAHTITKAMQQTMNPEFVSYVTHGLEVPHAHIHILPRKGGETAFVPGHKKFTDGEMKEVADTISRAIQS